ncbi:meiosis-specific protein MEI4-like [Lytechinus variegatus]|uniref:meiosis-specific protein MEI4-like n=1 Tax=Lytechinus variegatus TaxID=7654 RepID=UPI001BB198B2|nr:meiosis-specific protein MEI4-like [Lytechinus variegatus]
MMEATHSHPSESEQESLVTKEPDHGIQLDPAFVDRLKVAAATAIVKQKPPSMSGKDYAKQLAERLRRKEDSWKTKTKNLEMELLKTQQELLLAKTRASPHNDLNEREAVNAFHSESVSDEPAFLTPPSSSEECHHVDHQMALSRNTKFLHSLSTLSAVSRTEGHIKVIERSSEVIVNSVKTTVEYIMGKSKDKAPSHRLSSRMLQKAADAMVKTLDTRLPPGCRDDVISLIGKMVESILDDVMENSKICNTYSQRESCCTLIRLSKSSHLLPTILTSILEKIEKVSISLRNIRLHGSCMDVQLLENSFFLFSTMEDILVSIQASSSLSSSDTMSSKGNTLLSTKETHSQTRTSFNHHSTQNPSSVCDEDDNTSDKEMRVQSLRGKTGHQTQKLSLDQGFRMNIQQRLEDSLLHISNDFPLYAQYVWRLTGILELMNV